MNTVHAPNPNANQVFLYLDDANICISAKDIADEREGFESRGRVRIDFENLIAFAAAGRDIKKAMAVGSIPPQLRKVWRRLESTGIKVGLERGRESGTEQGVDVKLQTDMLSDAVDYIGTPGIACLLTGDSSGTYEDEGFYAHLKRLHKKGWGIEVIAWEQTCHSEMRQWVEEVGVFVPLEDFYPEVTFLEPALTIDERGTIQNPGRRALPVTTETFVRRPLSQNRTPTESVFSG